MARKIFSSDIRPLVEFEDGSTNKLVIESSGVNTNRVKIQRISKVGVATVSGSWSLPLCDIVTCLEVANFEFGAVAAVVDPPVIGPITPNTPRGNDQDPTDFGPNDPRYGNEETGFYDPSSGGYTVTPNPFTPGYTAPGTIVTTPEDEFNNPTYFN